jgi:DNA-binding NarL/FixJ family response regulator
MSYKILIADDHFVVRAGVNFIIESSLKNAIIDTAEDYYETIQKIKSEKYDLVILDLNMNGSKFKLMIPEIKLIQPEIKIMVFSVYDENIGIQYISEGANGYVNKLSPESEVIEAIISILETGSFYSTKMMQNAMLTLSNKNKNPLENLSFREAEIYNLLIRGNGNLEISNILDIHVSTVSTYKKRIFKKLKVTNIVELIEINHKFH